MGWLAIGGDGGRGKSLIKKEESGKMKSLSKISLPLIADRSAVTQSLEKVLILTQIILAVLIEINACNVSG